jgi:uncharacterized protein (TIGR03435 family)
MKKIAFLSFLGIMPTFSQQPKFDIADVHVSATAPAMAIFVQASGGVIREERYVNRDATMLSLIEAAYGVSEDTIVGGPAWLDSDLFDVIGKVPGGTTPATANLMLQALLTDRFRLVIRKDTRPVPRYVLSVGKDGSKLKRAAESGDSGCRQQLGSAPGGRPASVPNIKFACHNLTSQAIADNLQRMPGGYVDHPVVNSTKLEGAWDFELEYTMPNLLVDKSRDGITIFDAVNKQLGMKLELRGVPMPSLVIESVNRKPTENPASVTTALALAAARFEVATIKPADLNRPYRIGLSYDGGSQAGAGGTLRSLIALALEIPPPMAADMVVGLPKSADSPVWEITAKLPSSGEGAPIVTGGRPQAPPRSVALEMLRGLLADQFELKTHTENREVTAYAMMLAGAKPKMIRAEDSERSGCKVDYNAPKPSPKVSVMIVCKNTTMAEFARNLRNAAGYIDHPVVDVTGLKGGWDFQYGWSSARPTQSSQGPGPAGAAAQAVDPGEITVSDALQQQLGLKLVKQKRSIPVIVVDHLSENPVE